MCPSGDDTAANRRALVIGLDGVPLALLDSLRAHGVMPGLDSILRSGYSGLLCSTVPPISATAWTTFITGVNPGKHGILQFVTLRPGQRIAGTPGAQEVFPGGLSLLNADCIRTVTLWELLSEAGKRQVVINVPMTYPPSPIEGLLITGMMTPPSASVFTYPPGLSQRLRDAQYEIDLSISEREFDFNPARLIARLHEVLTKRLDIGRQLMQEERWDLFVMVFTGTDRLLHRFWKYLVPGFPEYDLAEAVRLRPRLDAFFAALDRGIIDLVNTAGSDTIVMILSDHGFGPVSERTVHRLSMMKALGLVQSGPDSGIVRLRRIVEGRLGLTPDQVRKWARNVLPGRWVERLQAQAREAQLSAGARGPAYSVTLHEYVGGIYINQDRLTAAEGGYEAFRKRIMLKLQELVDPQGGAPLVAGVYAREELYSGPALSDCPDVVFYLRPGYGLSGGVGPGGGLVSPRRIEPDKQGTHRDEGILVLYGPGVKPRRGAREQLIDATATILHSLGVPIPAAMDSRPILAAFSEQEVANHPPRYVDTPLERGRPQVDRSDRQATAEDEEQILERLRGLGYVE